MYQRKRIITNNQTTMTKGEAAHVSLLFWLLGIICFSGHWNLVIGYCPDEILL